MGLTLKSHLETWLWLMRKPGIAFVAGDKGQRSCPGRPVNLPGSLCLCWGSSRGHTAHFVGHTSDGEAKPLLAVETPGLGEIVAINSVRHTSVEDRPLSAQQEGAGFVLRSFKWELKKCIISSASVTKLGFWASLGEDSW